MQRFVLASSFLLAMTGWSVAAGAIVYAPPTNSETYSWSGVYVGADAGYGRASSTEDFDGIDYNVPLDPKGWFGGLYAGYNYQLPNNVVLGVEGDFNISNVSADGVHGISSGVDDPTYAYGSDLKWSSSLRGRLGYAAGPAMPFVTGGVAVGRYDISQTSINPYSASNTFAGWTLGAGVDYALTNNVLFRAEYRYADFGDKHIEIPGWTDQKVDLSTNDVRIGFAYKF